MAIKIMRLPPDQFRTRGYRTTPTPFFLLKVKKHPAAGARVGIVVGQSVHKAAVKRNFWKRQAMAVLAARAEGESDILIIALPGINRLTKKQFRDELSKALVKSQLK